MRTPFRPGARALAAALVAAAAFAACSKSAPETAPAPLNEDSVARSRAADSAAAAQTAARARSDSLAKAASDSAARVRAAADTKKAALGTDMGARVYFDFDQSTLTDSAKRTLDRKVAILNANPKVTIMVEGNTDERGAAEYNLALGQRRAAAVKRYLVQHGITEARITIISKGEEQPTATGHDEGSWALNRRDEFVITLGELTASP